MVVRSVKSFMLTSLMLVGPLAFVQALLFRPRMLTPYMSGEELVVPMELQALTAVAAFTVACLGASRLTLRPRRSPLVLWGIVVPLGCAALVVAVRSLWVPPIVAVGLALSCGVLLRTTLSWRSFGRDAVLGDYALSTIASLGVSSLLVHGSYSVSSTDANGTVVLAFIVAASGVLAVAGFGGDAREDCGVRKEPEPLGAAGWWRAVLPVVPAGLICSLSLGIALTDPSIEEAVRLVGPFATGAVASIVFVGALAWRWYSRSEEHSDEVILFMTVPCALSVLVSIVLVSTPFWVAYVVVTASNLMFLSLLWIDMLFLAGCRVGAGTALPVVALVLVLWVFCLGMLASHLVPPEVYRVAAPCAALAYLMYLVFYFQREQSRPSGALRRALEGGAARHGTEGAADSDDVEGSEGVSGTSSFAALRNAACAAMTADFGLSPKEGEVLPLLVTGLSAAAIGRQLFISHETVKTHKYHIYQKLGVHNFEEALDLFERYADGGGGEANPLP